MARPVGVLEGRTGARVPGTPASQGINLDRCPREG